MLDDYFNNTVMPQAIEAYQLPVDPEYDSLLVNLVTAAMEQLPFDEVMHKYIWVLLWDKALTYDSCMCILKTAAWPIVMVNLSFKCLKPTLIKL